MSRRTTRWALLALCLAALPWLPAADLGADDEGGTGPFEDLEFRSIGPAIGGRASRACGVPGDPRTFYAAFAQGGVWKSTDGGHAWKPIFDDQEVGSIGSIAVAPSDPNVVYVGTGESPIRGNASPGDGMYRSTDAGKTWMRAGLADAGQIGAIRVHPMEPDLVYVAVLGHAFGPNDQRGVFRSRDGGATWQRVLFRDADAGAVSGARRCRRVLGRGPHGGGARSSQHCASS